MRILYVSQYFPPEMGAPSARVYELSREWVGAGHDVTVLTGFAHHPTGVKAEADQRQFARREEVDGIDVLRTYVYATPNQGVLRRILSYASFMFSAGFIGAFRVRKPDIVIATSPQLLCACAGSFLAFRFRVPFVFEVRDLWPESIVAVHAMRENALVRALKRVTRFLYRHATHIVTVGEGYRRQISKRYLIPETRCSVVPNGIDPTLFKPGPKNNEVRFAYGWGDRFVVLYMGTLGMAHGLSTALRAAAQLQDQPEIRFVFVGEGAEKRMLKEQSVRMGLRNVEFIDQQPKARVPLFYAACDIGLVMLKNTPLFQDVLPSKMFEYLGMERPIVLTVGGEARRVVEDSGGGLYVEPEQPDRLAEAILALQADPNRLLDMGRRGRRYVLEHHHRAELARSYLDILLRYASGRGSR